MRMLSHGVSDRSNQAERHDLTTSKRDLRQNGEQEQRSSSVKLQVVSAVLHVFAIVNVPQAHLDLPELEFSILEENVALVPFPCCLSQPRKIRTKRMGHESAPRGTGTTRDTNTFQNRPLNFASAIAR